MERTRLIVSFVWVAGLFMLHAHGQICFSDCQPPDCSCPMFKYPMDTGDIPQMVYFGFDDAVNVVMASLYKRLFTPKRVNPNGCRMKMTLFVSNQYTDYSLVKQFYDQGMEIGVHSVTHSAIDSDDKLLREAKQQKEIIARAGVPEEEILGWRSPFLKPTTNQPKILKDLGYEYDISLTYTMTSASNPKPWPFTTHNGWPYRCGVPPCPRYARVPKFWEVPVISLMDYKQQYPCSFVDGCAISATTEDEAFKYLWDNFMSYYNTTRTPFGLNMHAAWFYTRYNLKAMMRFMDELQKMDDVYVVTVKQVIDWMKRPTHLSNIHTLESWSCPEAITVSPNITNTTTITTTTPRPTTAIPKTTTPTTTKPTTPTTTTPTTTTPTTTTPTITPSTTTPTTTTPTTTTPTTTTPTTTTPTTTTPTTTTSTTTTPTTTTPTTTTPTTTTPTTTTPTTTTPTTTTPTTTTPTTKTPTTTTPTTTTPTTTTPTTTTPTTTPTTTTPTTTKPTTTTPSTTTPTTTTPTTTTLTTTTSTTTTPTTTSPTTTTLKATTPTTTETEATTGSLGNKGQEQNELINSQNVKSEGATIAPFFAHWLRQMTSSAPPHTNTKPWWDFWSQPVANETSTVDSCVQGPNCMLPDCFCQGIKIPNNMKLENTPQMVYITVDGSATPSVYRRYRNLFQYKTNPNGCAARGTIFSTDENSHSYALKQMVRLGAEIAMQGVHEHHYDSEEHMEREIISQKISLARSGISNSSGWKTPELKLMGNDQFRLLKKHGFEYDATISMTAPRNKQMNLWPFTLDFGYEGACVIPECPTERFAGLWEIPAVAVKDYRKMFECNYIDGCLFNPPSANATQDFLWDNFLVNYNSNKAPFGIHMRQVWFSHPAYAKNLQGLQSFISKLLQLKDVYLVSTSDIIQWMKDPTPVQSITKTKPWTCISHQ